MTIILFLIETIYCNIFRWNYLRKKKLFLILFFAFLKFGFSFEDFQKEMTLLADVILNLGTRKNVIR